MVGDFGVVAVVGGVVGQGVPALVVGQEAGEVADGADDGGVGQCGWVGGQAGVQEFQQAVHAVEAVVGFEFGGGVYSLPNQCLNLRDVASWLGEFGCASSRYFLAASRASGRFR